MEGGATCASCQSAGRRGPDPRAALALLWVGGIYWLGIYPQVRRELARWEDLARRIADPVLRRHALAKLSDERLNPEAAALFAVLAPRARRRSAVTLIVAYQVLYDYLDAVNEDAEEAPLRNGLQLHRALAEALQEELPVSDYYAHASRREDGYVKALVAACRRSAQLLPALRRSMSVMERAAERCGQAQSHNHAIAVAGEQELIRWSLRHAPQRAGYLWWELAAGGISCLAIHALVACAADPRTSAEDAARVDVAYFPAVCAISALLDSLADYHDDAGGSNHSFVERYGGGGDVASRLVWIAADAARGIRGLRHSARHRVILAGICSYYLSSSTVERGFPAAAARTLARSAGHLATPMRLVLRMRRRLHRRGQRRPTPAAPIAPARARRRSPAAPARAGPRQR